MTEYQNYWEKVHQQFKKYQNQIDRLISESVSKLVAEVQLIYQELYLTYHRKLRQLKHRYSYSEQKNAFFQKICKFQPYQGFSLQRQYTLYSIKKLLLPSHISINLPISNQNIWHSQNYPLQQVQQQEEPIYNVEHKAKKMKQVKNPQITYIQSKIKATNNDKQFKIEGLECFDEYDVQNDVKQINLDQSLFYRKRTKRVYGLTQNQQKKLKNWIFYKIKNNQKVTWAIIQSMALLIVKQRPQGSSEQLNNKNSVSFKATKGWLAYFFRRYPQLKLVYQKYIIQRNQYKQNRNFLKKYPKQIIKRQEVSDQIQEIHKISKQISQPTFNIKDETQRHLIYNQQSNSQPHQIFIQQQSPKSDSYFGQNSDEEGFMHKKQLPKYNELKRQIAVKQLKKTIQRRKLANQFISNINRPKIQ